MKLIFSLILKKIPTLLLIMICLKPKIISTLFMNTAMEELWKECFENNIPLIKEEPC